MARSSDVLDAQEAADYLGAHVETVRCLARRGEIPAYKMGKDWRFSQSASSRWAERHHARSRPAHILVVDDEQVIHGLIGRALEPQGHRVSGALDGAEALSLMRRETPDVVLLDLQMPGMNGPAVLREIRKGYGDLPVIIITWYPDSDLMNEAMQCSPLLLLSKPITVAQLLAAVRLAVRGRPAAQAMGGQDA